MSEYIDNQTRRKEDLKRLLRQLHEGQTVDQVKGEFAALLEDVGAMDIAAIEQELVEEGMPVGEIKRLCDVHVVVFRESLETQEKPDTVPGHPVYTFLAENGAAGRLLDALEEAIGASEWEQAGERLRELRQYELHYVRKENILFPFLEKHNFSGPTAVMWAIHDDVRAGWKKLDELLAGDPDKESVIEVFDPLATAIREMFYKEENILYPTALEKLNGEEWWQIRQQSPEAGYCYVQPGNQWPPKETAMEAAWNLSQKPAASSAAGLLHLDTGTLTPQEVNRLLIHLPVDVTYVDADDTVRYFSQGRERIFPRSPAIVGRKVQKCHPPASLHRVQQILDDFRAGNSDEAEFWIQMGPAEGGDQFIHIRYFAMRDEQGEYQGTLEVSQDVAHIRALEGERRLLD
ncbi:MAG: DUF438 domain-containing protein, partial [Chloroflexota bacterium]|nr:DUF438 domain-containing protein [Chloroflexota bacterium]